MGQCIIVRKGGTSGKPPQVSGFMARGREKSAILTWTLPEKLDNYAGAVMVYQTIHTPSNETDGTTVIVGASASEYTVNGLSQNTLYYFRIFPFSPAGKYQDSLQGSFDNTRTATALPLKNAFSFFQLLTADGIFNPKKDGWYRIHCIGYCGEGGSGGGGATTSGSSSNCPPGGAGAGGNAGGYAISRLWLTTKDYVPVSVGGIASFGSYLSATRGGNGGGGGSGGYGTDTKAMGTCGIPSSTIGRGIGGNEVNSSGALGGAGGGKKSSAEASFSAAENGGNSGGSRGGSWISDGSVGNYGNGGGGGGRLYADKYTGTMASGKGAGGHTGEVFPKRAFSPTSGSSSYLDLSANGSPIVYGGGGGGGAGGGKDNSNAAQSSGAGGGAGTAACIIVETG